MKRIEADMVRKLLDAGKPGEVLILDVRQAWEYEEGHLPGALLISLSDLPDSLEKLDKSKPTILYCHSGNRSMAATLFLEGEAFVDVTNLEGGMSAWSGDMKNIDHLSLDGRSLYMLKQIYEHRSVTETARILGVTQSSVSHSLDRLRGLLGDPLFLKVGRTMVPTDRVEAMIDDIDRVLEGIESLYNQTEFLPADSNDRFAIVCNDFEHDLLVPPVFERLRAEAPNCSLRTFQVKDDRHEDLKKGLADISLRPYPPDNTGDLVISEICSDHMITYYDPQCRDAPKSVDDYVAAEHAILSMGRNEETSVDRALSALGKQRKVSYLGTNFTSVAMVVRGTDMLATAPSRLAPSIFRDFKWVEPPVSLPAQQFYMIWHVRHRHSPRHKWFRDLVKTVAKQLPQTSTVCTEVEANRARRLPVSETSS